MAIQAGDDNDQPGAPAGASVGGSGGGEATPTTKSTTAANLICADEGMEAAYNTEDRRFVAAASADDLPFVRYAASKSPFAVVNDTAACAGSRQPAKVKGSNPYGPHANRKKQQHTIPLDDPSSAPRIVQQQVGLIPTGSISSMFKRVENSTGAQGHVHLSLLHEQIRRGTVPPHMMGLGPNVPSEGPRQRRILPGRWATEEMPEQIPAGLRFSEDHTNVEMPEQMPEQILTGTGFAESHTRQPLKRKHGSDTMSCNGQSKRLCTEPYDPETRQLESRKIALLNRLHDAGNPAAVKYHEERREHQPTLSIPSPRAEIPMSPCFMPMPLFWWNNSFGFVHRVLPIEVMDMDHAAEYVRLLYERLDMSRHLVLWADGSYFEKTDRTAFAVFHQRESAWKGHAWMMSRGCRVGKSSSEVSNVLAIDAALELAIHKVMMGQNNNYPYLRRIEQVTVFTTHREILESVMGVKQPPAFSHMPELVDKLEELGVSVVLRNCPGGIGQGKEGISHAQDMSRKAAEMCPMPVQTEEDKIMVLRVPSPALEMRSIMMRDVQAIASRLRDKDEVRAFTKRLDQQVLEVAKVWGQPNSYPGISFFPGSWF